MSVKVASRHGVIVLSWVGNGIGEPVYQGETTGAGRRGTPAGETKPARQTSTTGELSGFTPEDGSTTPPCWGTSSCSPLRSTGSRYTSPTDPWEEIHPIWMICPANPMTNPADLPLLRCLFLHPPLLDGFADNANDPCKADISIADCVRQTRLLIN